jgi:hypothetical protein
MIRSIYLRDRDNEWIKALYPHLKAFLEWWLKNRTDQDGWFHAKCSWESGQDASRRFLVPGNDPAGVADYVRTADIEAAMAEAMNNMVLFAVVAGRTEDRQFWTRLAENRVSRVRSMYVDGWFRDFDARTNNPIVLKDYFDVMMMAPLTVGLATPEQMEAIKPMFRYFQEHPQHSLEWPSRVFLFSEAAWNAGVRELLAQVVTGTGDRIYTRRDSRQVRPPGPASTDLPKKYNYRIPGVAGEFWPLAEDNPGGGENYGWGATLPTLVIRNVIGFREVDDPARGEFLLAPAFPSKLAESGKTYGIKNLRFRGTRLDVSYHFMTDRELVISLAARGESLKSIGVRDDKGKLLVSSKAPENEATVKFNGANGGVYTIALIRPAALAQPGDHP